MAGWIAPPKGPFVPKIRLVFPLPENTRRIDLGFPPLSHAHLNQRVPTGNEELPDPQPHPDDFGSVLRKKHAAERHHRAGMRVTHPSKYRFRFNNLSGQARSSGEQRCFRSNSAIAGSGLLRKCAQ